MDPAVGTYYRAGGDRLDLTWEQLVALGEDHETDHYDNNSNLFKFYQTNVCYYLMSKMFTLHKNIDADQWHPPPPQLNYIWSSGATCHRVNLVNWPNLYMKSTIPSNSTMFTREHVHIAKTQSTLYYFYLFIK